MLSSPSLDIRFERSDVWYVAVDGYIHVEYVMQVPPPKFTISGAVLYLIHAAYQVYVE